MRLTPAILCGGSGTRLWPVSRRRVPKQFHAFLNGASLLEAAARRVSGAEFNPVIAIGATDACHLVRHQIEQAGSRIGKIICEPVSRNTAPAIAALCAVLIDEQDDSPVVAIPSDHYIPDSRGLIDAVEAMLDDVDNGSIGIIGITPTRADTDLGYIMLSGAGTRGVAADVRSFVEKPSAEQAEALVAGGEAYWNAGIFVFRPSALWQELNKFAPELAKLAAEAARKGRRAGLVHHLDQDVFSACPNVSIDTAVMVKKPTLRCVCPRACPGQTLAHGTRSGTLRTGTPATTRRMEMWSSAMLQTARYIPQALLWQHWGVVDLGYRGHRGCGTCRRPSGYQRITQPRRRNESWQSPRVGRSHN